MKKPLKYSLWTLAVLVILFLSLDIRKLEEFEAENTAETFNAKEYARDFFENKLPEAIKKAPELVSLIELLETDPQQAFEIYGQKLGIAKTWYFMVKGNGVIESVGEENLVVKIDSHLKTRVATAFIFGNAVRDGSGGVDIDEFLNMTDFNNVSIAINDIVKSEIVPPVKTKAEPGMMLEFAGAFEIKEDELDIQTIRIIPVSLKLNDGTTE